MPQLIVYCATTMAHTSLRFSSTRSCGPSPAAASVSAAPELPADCDRSGLSSPACPGTSDAVPAGDVPEGASSGTDFTQSGAQRSAAAGKAVLVRDEGMSQRGGRGGGAGEVKGW